MGPIASTGSTQAPASTPTARGHLSYGSSLTDTASQTNGGPVSAVLRLLADRPTPATVLLQADADGTTGEIRAAIDSLVERLREHYAVPVLVIGKNDARFLPPRGLDGHARGLGIETIRVSAVRLPGTLTVPSFLLERIVVVTVIVAGTERHKATSALATQASLLKPYNRLASPTDLACEAHRVSRSDALLAMGTDQRGTPWWIATDDDVQLERLLAAASGIKPRSWPALQALSRTFLCDLDSPVTLPFSLKLSQPSSLRVRAAGYTDSVRRMICHGVFLVTAARRVLPRLVSAVRRRMQH